jgi:hypothetical protein
MGQCYEIFLHGKCPLSTVLLLFCVIKQYYHRNYHRMAIYYHGKKFLTLAHGGKLKQSSNLPRKFNPTKSRVKITTVNYSSKLPQYFYNIGLRCLFLKFFCVSLTVDQNKLERLFLTNFNQTNLIIWSLPEWDNPYCPVLVDTFQVLHSRVGSGLTHKH